MLSPFECLCGNFILPEPASYVFFYAFFNLRNLLYIMLVSIPPKYSVSQIMGYLKGKSSLMIYEKYANLKYKYGNRHFWCRGYYVSTVGRNRRAIEEYIRNQLQEDYTDDQLSIKEFVDPFTGEPVRGGK